MEHIAMLDVIAFLVIFIGILWLYFEYNHKTMELEDLVTELPPPPEVNNNFNILYDMTKYRVISRVLCDDGESCTFYYPQRKTLLRWKDIKQNGETVKFRSLYEAFRYIDGDPSATNIEQRPSKLSNYIDCWVYHTSARTNEEDLREFLKPTLKDFSVWKLHGHMLIYMRIDSDCWITLMVRPGDCVILYPDGQVYVVPNLDNFPYPGLSTK